MIGSHNFSAEGAKKWIGPLIMRDDIRVVHPVIITVATVGNLRSLDLSLIINLIVEWPNFESFLYPYLVFWYQIYPIRDVSNSKKKKWTPSLNLAY